MEQVNTDIALLITGTIVPNSNFVAHTDVAQRRREYYDNLVFYSNAFPGHDLYFLENSAYDLASDAAFMQLLEERKITLLKFPVSDKYTQGKGYQEFEMLDKAIEQLCGKHLSFVKITGRYRVHNLHRLVSGPCPGLVADSHKKFAVTQTNVFYVTGEFYKNNLKGLYLNVNDEKGVFIEKLVYQVLVNKNLFHEVKLFPVNPVITGISGSYGGTLNRNKLKMRIRNIERLVLGWMGKKEFLTEY